MYKEVIVKYVWKLSVITATKRELLKRYTRYWYSSWHYATGTGGGGGQHEHAHAVVALAAARVEAGVLRARGGRAQAGREARVGRGRLGRGAHVGRRRLPVAAPLGALLGPQAALHRERRAGRHGHAAVLGLRLRRRVPRVLGRHFKGQIPLTVPNASRERYYSIVK